MSHWRHRDRFPRTKQARPAAAALESVIDHYKLARPMQERRVLVEWREIVGERIASRTWPGKVVEGVLKVRVSNSAWMHELSFMTEELTKRLAARTNGLVKELRFYLGRPHPHARAELSDADSAARQPAPPEPPIELEPARGEELARIEAETESVVDDELRAIIREARRKINR